MSVDFFENVGGFSVLPQYKCFYSVITCNNFYIKNGKINKTMMGFQKPHGSPPLSSSASYYYY